MNVKIKLTYEKYWNNRKNSLKNEAESERTPNEIFDTVASILEGGHRLLDVGCGDGAFSCYVRNRFKEIHGVEIAKKAADVAKRRGMIVGIMDLNSKHVPYRKGSFDVVTCLDVIEHVFDPISVLSEIHRVLRPRGQLVLTTPNIRYFRPLFKLIFKGVFPHTTTDSFVWGGGHLHYFTRKDLEGLLRRATFRKVDFHINQDQFARSKKRKWIRVLVGEKLFGEWFCGSITASAYKDL